MKSNIGSNIFGGRVPVLWGRRVLIVDDDGKASIILLDSGKATAEIVKGEPGDGIHYLRQSDGYIIRSKNHDLYFFRQSGADIEISPKSLKLPPVQISANVLNVGGATLSGSMIMAEVGVVVSEEGGMGIGGRIPAEYRHYFEIGT